MSYWHEHSQCEYLNGRVLWTAGPPQGPISQPLTAEKRISRMQTSRAHVRPACISSFLWCMAARSLLAIPTLIGNSPHVAYCVVQTSSRLLLQMQI